MTLFQRAKAPTPKLFKTLRNIGLALAAASAAIMTAPVAIPASIISIAGYVAVAGAIMTALSQITVASE
ncbi:MAG: hypothetical protein HYU69_13950 [Bacteroidetes bacterium]|nr:hypothetical protein [Bacteroidota bacterium]